MFCPKCGTESQGDAQFCRRCGNALAPLAPKEARGASGHGAAVLAAVQSDKPMRVLLLLIGAAFVAFVVWELVAHGGSHSPAPPAAQSSPATPDDTPSTQQSPAATLGAHTVPELSAAPPQLVLPPQEAAFVSMVRSFVPNYSQADTEIRKTNVRFGRKDAMAKLFSSPGGLLFEDWIGTVKSITTESDGEAALSLTLPGYEDCTIATWNNSFSDSSAHTMISRSDHLYNSLMDLKSGDLVSVSGTFLPSDNQADYVKESSLTEEGSMTSPDFIVRFTEIRPNRQ